MAFFLACSRNKPPLACSRSGSALGNWDRKLDVESSSGVIVTDNRNLNETTSTKPAIVVESSSYANRFFEATCKPSANIRICFLITLFGA